MWIKTSETLPPSLPDGIRVAIIGPAYDDYSKGTFVSGSVYYEGNFYTEDGDDMHWPCYWAEIPDELPTKNGEEVW